MVFYRSWLDDWTVASSNLLMALEPANQSYVLDSVSSTVAFVIEADFVAINQAASLVKQSYKFKDQECDRWSYQAVWDAIDRLSRVPLPKLIVIVTETYGGSRDDQDVVDGCKAAQK